jgi:hypothetical protein
MKSFLKATYLIFYNILRYYNFIKINYAVEAIVDFGSYRANSFFLDKLKKSNSYFEYGSGRSTLVAKKLKKSFISIESDRSFFNYLKKFNIKNIRLIDFGWVYFFSVPIFFFMKKKKLSKIANRYSDSIFLSFKKIPDLILIDGRYRVLCALKVYFFLKKYKKERTLVILDDFKNREKDYSIVKKMFHIKMIDRLAVMNIKTNFLCKKNLINIYEKVYI